MPWMFDICDTTVGLEVLRPVIEWLRWVDASFSTYRAGSQIAQLNRGELPRDQLHPQVCEVLDRCEQLRAVTGGYFDIATPYRAGSGPEAGYGGPGSVDPSGLVKGWAIARAARQLRDAGAQNFSLNAGGDALLSGHPDGDDRWRVGIQHPRSTSDVAMTLGLRDMAIATSGAYVRGAHIHVRSPTAHRQGCCRPRSSAPTSPPPTPMRRPPLRWAPPAPLSSASASTTTTRS